MKTNTHYVIIENGTETGTRESDRLCTLLDNEYVLIKTWVVGSAAHHILSKKIDED